jgi:TRAP-type mannitol/chloroaromatic compound transport system permease small subunit
MLTRFADLVDGINDRIGRAIAWLVLAMVVLLCAQVVARNAFDWASQGLAESATRLHALVFMLGLGYTLTRDEHVRVDLLSRRWSPRGKALMELLGVTFLLSPFCLLLFFSSLDYVADSWRVLESSRETGGLPGVFLMKTVILLAALLLLLAGLARAARAWCVLRGLARPPAEPAAHGPLA